MNINSLRNKFDLLSEHIKGSIDILMISETKLDYSFPDGQFLIEGYHAPFRFDRNKWGGGIILYLKEDIPAKAWFRFCREFFIKIILHKRKWLFNCSYNSHKNNIIKHLELISRSLDTFSMKYNNIILLWDFNVCFDDETTKSFWNSFCLESLIKQPAYFKNPGKPSCLDIILTNRPRPFQS